MNPHEIFEQECREEIGKMGRDERLGALSREYLNVINPYKYSYHFSWLSRPVIQYPQDIVAMQELIWRIKPDLIVETGIAHGGSLVFSASMLALLDMAEAIEAGVDMCPGSSRRLVLGIDIDIRAHNRAAIEAHPMASRIAMLQGSSVDPEIVAQVRERASTFKRVLVCLDSMHTHDHVLRELEAYAPLVTSGSYCVVFDTIIENMPETAFPDRPWGKGDNPMTAVHEYLQNHSEFVVDESIPDKLQLTVAPGGYLRRA